MGNEFKVGDRVKVVLGQRDRPELKGMTGKIVADGGDGLFGVEFADWNRGHAAGRGDSAKSRWWLYPGDLDLVPAPKKFKVGDLVKVREGGESPQMAGMVGKVVNRSASTRWTVEFDGWDGGHTGGQHNGSHSSWYFDQHELELAPAPNLKVGDRARVKKLDADSDIPEFGIISDIVSDDWILVEFEGWDGGHSGVKDDNSTSTWGFEPKDLEPVATPPAEYIVLYGGATTYDDEESAIAEAKAWGNGVIVARVIAKVTSETTTKVERV